MPRANRRPWTDDDDAVLLDAAARGLKGQAIYDLLPDRTPGAIATRLSYLRQQGTPVARRPGGWPRGKQRARALDPAPTIAPTKKRRCLGCGHNFASAGIGNRLCGSCSKRCADASPIEAWA